MPIHYAGLEGEYALYNNELNQFGADSQRRGSVKVGYGKQIIRNFPQGDDTWIHVRLTGEVATSISKEEDFIAVYSGNYLIAYFRRTNRGGSAMGFTARVGSILSSAPPYYGSIEYVLSPTQFSNFDIRIEVSGQVTMYYNEVVVFRAQAPDLTNARPNLLVISQSDGNSNAEAVYVQDVIISDGVPTVGMELVGLPPAAVGNYNEFTNDYDDISGPGYNSSSTIWTDETGRRESWIHADSDFNLGDKIIYAFVQSTVAQLSVANTVADFEPFLRIDGVDYTGPALGAVNYQPEAYMTIWETNPATNQPWTRQDFRGLESGIQTV